MLVGAAAATALILHASELLPALQLLPLIAVEVASVKLIRRGVEGGGR